MTPLAVSPTVVFPAVSMPHVTALILTPGVSITTKDYKDTCFNLQKSSGQGLEMWLISLESLLSLSIQ
jgi:hypothetical protein